jgi:hypothetical protein
MSVVIDVLGFVTWLPEEWLQIAYIFKKSFSFFIGREPNRVTSGDHEHSLAGNGVQNLQIKVVIL